MTTTKQWKGCGSSINRALSALTAEMGPLSLPLKTTRKWEKIRGTVFRHQTTREAGPLSPREGKQAEPCDRHVPLERHFVDCGAGSWPQVEQVSVSWGGRNQSLGRLSRMEPEGQTTKQGGAVQKEQRRLRRHCLEAPTEHQAGHAWGEKASAFSPGRVKSPCWTTREIHGDPKSTSRTEPGQSNA